MPNAFQKIIFLLFLSVLFCPFLARAQNIVNIYFFYGDGCSHCAREEKFLDKLEQENKDIKIYRYETWHNRENAKLLGQIGKELDLNITGVPALIIGSQTVIGFLNEATTGKKIRSIIQKYSQYDCDDIVSTILNANNNNQCAQSCAADDVDCLRQCGCETSGKIDAETIKSVNLSFFGEINIKNLSLPVFTVLIAAADGFNPCAMWVLLFLISLLLGMKDRKRMWTLGLAFIVVSAAVYFLFVFIWLKFFLVLGYVSWVRLAVGVVAIVSGAYHLKEYWTNREGACHVAGAGKRRLVFKKLREIVGKQVFWLALGGVILLAAAVNLVELVCSAGFPQVFTQVLAQANLFSWQRYFYLFLYIFIFMLDDLFIFVIAMKTLEIKAISSKYTRWSNLVGGVLIFIIGLLLIFKPGWLILG